jgi:hypothetical protein
MGVLSKFGNHTSVNADDRGSAFRIYLNEILAYDFIVRPEGNATYKCSFLFPERNKIFFFFNT